MPRYQGRPGPNQLARRRDGKAGGDQGAAGTVAAAGVVVQLDRELQPPDEAAAEGERPRSSPNTCTSRRWARARSTRWVVVEIAPLRESVARSSGGDEHDVDRADPTVGPGQPPQHVGVRAPTEAVRAEGEQVDPARSVSTYE